MTGIESTQVGPESVEHVGSLATELALSLLRLRFADEIGPEGTFQALSDALADINQLRALIAGLRDDAHQRAVEAAGRDAHAVGGGE